MASISVTPLGAGQDVGRSCLLVNIRAISVIIMARSGKLSSPGTLLGDMVDTTVVGKENVVEEGSLGPALGPDTIRFAKADGCWKGMPRMKYDNKGIGLGGVAPMTLVLTALEKGNIKKIMNGGESILPKRERGMRTGNRGGKCREKSTNLTWVAMPGVKEVKEVVFHEGAILKGTTISGGN